MKAPRLNLTAQLQADICGYILSGGYPEVAAQVAGVPREVFDDWMKRGRSLKAAKKYRAFRKAVLQAQAHARLAAEARTLTKDPLNWLKCGPGKDTTGSPGWSNPARVTPGKGGGPWLMNPDFQELIALLLKVLQPYPEVRTAVADELAKEERQQRERPEEE